VRSVLFACGGLGDLKRTMNGFTVAALPGILLFWIMMRTGLVDASIGTAGTSGSGDVRAAHPDEETAKA